MIKEEDIRKSFNTLKNKFGGLGDDLNLKKKIVRTKEFRRAARMLLLKHGDSHASDLLMMFEDDLYMDDDITASDVLDRKKLASLCKILIEEDKQISRG